MSGNDLASLLPLVVLLVFGYLLFIRPARKRAQAVTELQNALSPGDEVMLTSGIFATVVEVLDEQVRVEVAPGVVLSVHRGAIGKITHDVPAADDASYETDDAPYETTDAPYETDADDDRPNPPAPPAPGTPGAS